MQELLSLRPEDGKYYGLQITIEDIFVHTRLQSTVMPLLELANAGADAPGDHHLALVACHDPQGRETLIYAPAEQAHALFPSGLAFAYHPSRHSLVELSPLGSALVEARVSALGGIMISGPAQQSIEYILGIRHSLAGQARIARHEYWDENEGVYKFSIAINHLQFGQLCNIAGRFTFRPMNRDLRKGS